MKISTWQQGVIEKLSAVSDTPKLDADLLLMQVLKKTRAALFLDKEATLSEIDCDALNHFVLRRLAGEPMAYLLGTQPFWTMDLIVTKDTLIPRPETECLIEWILQHFSTRKEQGTISIADLGTGSGAIALALARENNAWEIDATDYSHAALVVAKKNADHYAVKNITFYQGDWCDALPPKKYDVIISNPPYIAAQDPHLNQLTFEPIAALVSGEKGLTAIEKITAQATFYLKPNGYLVIEHGFDQATAVYNLFEKNNFTDIQNHVDLSNLPRFVTGKWLC